MLKKINISIYFFITWLFSLYLCNHFLQNIPANTLRDQIYSLLLLSTYAFIYQLPAIICYWILNKRAAIAVPVAIILTILSHIYIFIDSHLYDLYAFHLNGFVWNLITTPGGIDSLGADQTNISLILTYILVLSSVHITAILLAYKFNFVLIRLLYVVVIFLFLTITERFMYGYSQAQLYAPVLERAESMPLYQPMTIHGLLKQLGIKVKKAHKVKILQAEGDLTYPKQSINLDKIDKPFNIVMLVSESMRWDLLSPKIMPNMSSFAQQAWNFKRHYSGGNGTRQGIFALFYGIPGNYWDKFLLKEQEPVLFDVLNDYKYQYFIYTSASFTYPEMDRTIFSQIPKNKLIENNQGEPWKRDITNTSALINAIKNRDKEKPYFGYLFYEGTHARYSFSQQHVVRSDYLKTLDYAGLSREELAPNIDGMKARYENAAYGVDRQLQRIVSFLQQTNEMDNTLLIITGDHGEEFMERGRWGHNSSFTDWQIRVPLIVWIPHSQPRTIDQRTSHMDIAPTILKRLGVQNPVKDYSTGIDLGSPVENRTITVASWSDIGLINDEGKLVIPFKSTSQHKNFAMDLHDHPITSSELIQKNRPLIMQALINAQYYSSKKKKN